MRDAILPKWANEGPNNTIVVNSHEMYRDWLDKLGFKSNEISPYALALSKLCATKDIQLSVAGTNLSAPKGGALFIVIKGDRKYSMLGCYDKKMPKDQMLADMNQQELKASKDAKQEFAKVMGVSI